MIVSNKLGYFVVFSLFLSLSCTLPAKPVLQPEGDIVQEEFDASESLPDVEVIARKWGSASEVGIYRANTCESTSGACLPTTMTNNGKLYTTIWSPTDQLYDIYWIVTDAASGAIKYMNNTTVLIGCGNCARSYSINSPVISALPAGYYTFTAYVYGHSDWRGAVSQQFTYYKL